MINITDSYELRETFDDIKHRLIPEENEDTLELGMYNIMSSMIANMTSSVVQTAADKANEVFYTRARLASSIIMHSSTYNVNVNAVPAQIDVLLCFIEDEIEDLFKKNESDTEPVIIDSKVSFLIGKYEYHLEYPLLIYKKELLSGTVYTAQYDTSKYNPIATITNPYLASPYIIKNSGYRYLYIPCTLVQVQLDETYEKINTNVSINNKTFIAKFNNQISGIDIIVKEDNEIKHIKPILEGSSVDQINTLYCWYTFINSDTIRVKFDDSSYIPSINTEITIRLYNTLGEECNFSYNNDMRILRNIEDTPDYRYNSISVEIIPQSDSRFGVNRKSIKELKSLLPLEALSRGSITKKKDLENYFNKLNSDTVKTVPSLKVDNQAIREHYLYFLMKDSNNCIVPTNTLPVNLTTNEFDEVLQLNGKTHLILKQGHVFGYNRGDLYATMIPSSAANSYDFSYTIPFKTVINAAGPSISYYLTTMNELYTLDYRYVNSNSPVQFISSTSKWNRAYSGTDSDKYKLTLRVAQNIDLDYGIGPNEIMAIAVLKNSEGVPTRYLKSETIEYTQNNGRLYDLSITFETNDVIDENNNIRIDNGYAIGQDTIQYGYFENNCNVDLYLLAKITDPVTETVISYGLEESGILDIVGNLSTDFTCTNIYNIKTGIDFFINFSEVMSTVVKATSSESSINRYNLDLVPLLGYQYSLNDTLLVEFFKQLKLQEEYINNVLYILEGGTSVDFKFFNTYGQSRLYKLSKDGKVGLDRVNISLSVDVNLKKSSDTYTSQYIKSYIKDQIDNMDKRTDYHIPNLISEINSKYSNSIYYTELGSINDYGNKYTHFYYTDDNRIGNIPEFVCINIKDGKPDISINIIE